MRRLFKRVGTLVVLIQITSASSSALAGPLMTELIGSWAGVGQVARTYEARLQKVSCEAEVRRGESDSELLVDGLCVVSSGRSRFAILAVADRDNRVLAGARVQGFDEAVQLADVPVPGRMDLTSRAPVSHNGKLFHLRIILEVGDDDRLGISQQIRPDESDTSRETFLIKMDRAPENP
jgi:hypothetical protein